MGKSVSGGKSENITMRCDAELKARALKLHAEKYSQVPFNYFLGQLIEWGLDEAEELHKSKEEHEKWRAWVKEHPDPNDEANEAGELDEREKNSDLRA